MQQVSKRGLVEEEQTNRGVLNEEKKSGEVGSIDGEWTSLEKGRARPGHGERVGDQKVGGHTRTGRVGGAAQDAFSGVGCSTVQCCRLANLQ